MKQVLRDSGSSHGFCARLPDLFMVYFVLAMGLFCRDSYRQVFRWLRPWKPGGVPGRSTLCEARRRLGPRPLVKLAQQTIQLLADQRTPGAFYRGLRLMALDGFVVDVPDTPDNARVFGRPHGGRTPGAFPQVPLVALCEAATHVMWRWLIKPIHVSEQSMADWLLRLLEPGMLLMWDRSFLSYARVRQTLDQGACLLARIKKQLVFQPIRRLEDGSYLAKLYRNNRYMYLPRRETNVVGNRVDRASRFTEECLSYRFKTDRNVCPTNLSSGFIESTTVFYNLRAMEETLQLEFDGGSRGNPGPAGIGVVVRAADGTPVITLGRFIGRATNNVAEYRALIAAMQQAQILGAKRIEIRGDSELIIRQMRGEYRVKNPDLKILHDEAQQLLHQFDRATIQHNLRHKNELADRLANLAMDRRGEVTDVDPVEAIDMPEAQPPRKGDRWTCPRCRCAITIEIGSSVRPHQLQPFVCQCGTKMHEQ